MHGSKALPAAVETSQTNVPATKKFALLMDEDDDHYQKAKEKKSKRKTQDNVSKETAAPVVIKGKRIRRADKEEKTQAWDILDANEDFDSDPGEAEQDDRDADYDSERERDIKERDEFAARLKEKDLEKQLVIFVCHLLRFSLKTTKKLTSKLDRDKCWLETSKRGKI